MTDQDYSIDRYSETLDRFSGDPHYQMRLITHRLDWLVRLYSQSKTETERRYNKGMVDQYVELFSRVYFRKLLHNTDNP